MSQIDTPLQRLFSDLNKGQQVGKDHSLQAPYDEATTFICDFMIWLIILLITNNTDMLLSISNLIQVVIIWKDDFISNQTTGLDYPIMSLNRPKYLKIFHHIRNITCRKVSLMIDSEPVNKVVKTKYLGANINVELS